MQLLRLFNQFKEEIKQNHLAEMESLGLCPDCSGSRITPTIRAIHSPPPNCSGCNGTGLFEEWVKGQ